MYMLNVQVTQENIDAGVQTDPNGLRITPLAQALQCYMLRQPHVDGSYVVVNLWDGAERRLRCNVAIPLPAPAVKFNSNMLAGHPVQPFTFDLRLPI